MYPVAGLGNITEITPLADNDLGNQGKCITEIPTLPAGKFAATKHGEKSSPRVVIAQPFGILPEWATVLGVTILTPPGDFPLGNVHGMGQHAFERGGRS